MHDLQKFYEHDTLRVNPVAFLEQFWNSEAL